MSEVYLNILLTIVVTLFLFRVVTGGECFRSWGSFINCCVLLGLVIGFLQLGSCGQFLEGALDAVWNQLVIDFK